MFFELRTIKQPDAQTLEVARHMMTTLAKAKADSVSTEEPQTNEVTVGAIIEAIGEERTPVADETLEELPFLLILL